jgi:pyruvate dehydrogenase E1 component alpha subunit
VADGHQLDPQSLARIYRSLRLIRRAEERVADIYPSDKIKSPVHLSIGQESAAVGVCDVLRPDDVVSGTYRGHATYIAKDGDLPAMFAELYGKVTGCARGKGGSMHLIDMGHNVLGTSAVVGTTVPLGLGVALAAKRQKRDIVVAVFFGDGATEEGVFYESLNFASLHKLPVIFVLENNGYAIHEPQTKRWASDRMCERVETFGIPATQVADGDVLAIRAAALTYAERARAGGGPGFIEAKIYRWREHVGPGRDFDQGYRSEAELEPWLKRDDVERIGRMLPEATRARLDADVEAQVEAAVAFAEASPFPALEELYQNVLAR